MALGFVEPCTARLLTYSLMDSRQVELFGDQAHYFADGLPSDLKEELKWSVGLLRPNPLPEVPS